MQEQTKNNSIIFKQISGESSIFSQNLSDNNSKLFNFKIKVLFLSFTFSNFKDFKDNISFKPSNDFDSISSYTFNSKLVKFLLIFLKENKVLHKKSLLLPSIFCNISNFFISLKLMLNSFK